MSENQRQRTVREGAAGNISRICMKQSGKKHSSVVTFSQRKSPEVTKLTKLDGVPFSNRCLAFGDRGTTNNRLGNPDPQSFTPHFLSQTVQNGASGKMIAVYFT
ncbi:MAG: hypothetical protein IJH91_06845 [Mogibacterium sp.]|nr:hypothetical protein [Mogibacterium sp.]